RYQAGHGVWIAANPASWGAWAIPEAEVQVLPDVAGKDVLELGCGAAQWSVCLDQRGARVTGLDLSGRQLEHARRAVVTAGVEVRLVHGSAERLPVAEGVFDLVLSDHGAMSWGDPDRTVPEVARVLRPGGLLVFCASSPFLRLCWDDEAGQWGAPGDRLRRDYFGLKTEAEGDGAVSFTLPYGEWVRRFRAHGLAVEALVEPRPARGVVSPFYPDATAWVQRWPAELIWKVRREAPDSSRLSGEQRTG
ncbi:MAG: class I SAM-dependent methyltransferase, partial [Chloroflexota bacterium]